MSNNDEQQGFTPGYWGQPTPSHFAPAPLPASVQSVPPSLPSAGCPDCEPTIDALTPRQQGRMRFLRWLREHDRIGEHEAEHEAAVDGDA